MALIPPDAALRMRLQTEANLLQPVQPAHEISADLPELQAGQLFSARIQETLPDHTYRALVAGRQLTLQLPEGAKPGDRLDLVVIDRSAKTIIARRAEGGVSPVETPPYAYLRFSPTARLIGQILPAADEAPLPAPLNRGEPLAARPPLSADATAQLAAALGKAVAHSGVFYEAHQAQWVRGRLPPERLLLEPQANHASPPARPAAVIAPVPTHPPAPTQPAGTGGTATQDVVETRPRIELARLPDELRPIVQQQLEAAATQRLVWHGEVWPQQSVEWEIRWDEERNAADKVGAERQWRTRLSLTMPRLGRIDASLRLAGQAVSIELVADASCTSLLHARIPQLGAALAAAGVALTGCTIRQAATTGHG